MHLGEALRFSVHALNANRLRTFLTALGLVIGNAAVILVVTISLTSRDFILEQISSIGSNMLYAYYEAGTFATRNSDADFVKLADLEAIREHLGNRIVAATGVQPATDRIYINGKEQDISVNGTDEYYGRARNLAVVAGRFFDGAEVRDRQKVALVTLQLAGKLFGSPRAALGQTLKLFGLQFTIIGVVKERASTYGLSELGAETALVPLPIARLFVPVERLDPVYVQAKSAADVPMLTRAVQQIIESRHRPGAKYKVENLGPILETANSVALVLTIVLILIAAIALIISGIGIMNIMLVTVTERTREIGVRMAIGAARRDVLQQFLIEAVLISFGGGLFGTALGILGPLSVQWFVPEIRIPISKMSVAISLLVSGVVGLVFGTLPAVRASRLNPTEALRYE